MQYIFDMHFLCSCIPGLHVNGVLYLVLPPFILMFVVNILEPFQLRKVFYSMHCLTCEGYTRSFGGCVATSIFKYVSLAAIWIASVLFDGDWYFCLMTNLNLNQTGIPCKANFTYEEQRIQHKYMKDSNDYALYVIFGFVFVWSIYEMRRAFCRSRHQCCPPYYSVVYEDLLAEEVSSLMNQKLKNIAAQKAKIICKLYLQNIRRHELMEQNEEDVDISDTWKIISASDFYLMENEKCESAV
ncbi:uncharacterized protein LOC109197544 [Oreochromis niloticus]|uniref:uncharacterized protein LOC109197544 n=1 Tax=Oreochromis niloticus TaxID=8128 RepID=UPI000904B84D|nr:uncharacterized protein LOC109197544 [Oreochromis niloticus]